MILLRFNVIFRIYGWGEKISLSGNPGMGNTLVQILGRI
jgi:hypothetical protein